MERGKSSFRNPSGFAVAGGGQSVMPYNHYGLPEIGVNTSLRITGAG